MPNAELTRDGPVAVPLDYDVPNGGDLAPVSVAATLDGTSAASNFYAVLQVLDPNGRSMGKYISSFIAAGGSAEVTWFRSVMGGTSAGGSGSGPAVLFDETTAGTVGTIDTGPNGIAQTHTDLLIVTYFRTNEAMILREDGAVFFNADNAAANYKTQRIRLQGSTVDGWLNTASTGFNCFMCAGTSADAGTYAPSFVYIPNYTSSQRKGGIGLEGSIGQYAATANWWLYVTNNAWNKSVPITQATFTPNVGAGGSFVAGSRVTIYGMG